MPFETLLPLIKKSGSNLFLQEFHHQVNVIFHDIESDFYDEIHQDMWETLLEQFQLLTSDFSEKLDSKESITFMDVGSGTGLGTELMLATPLSARIGKVTLVDVSAGMMKNALMRSQKWNKQTVSIIGTLDSVEEKADLILTSSVLHHIPDLDGFFQEIDRHLNPGGVFMHIHDPNGDHFNNETLKSRQKEASELDRVTTLYQFLNSSPFFKEIFHGLNRLRGKKNHIDLVNEKLISKGVIKKRLTAKEIWSITDIHVEGLPYSTQSGISLKEIGKSLPDYELVGHRSYGFYGRLGFELLDDYPAKEQNLIKEGSKEGRYLGAAWKKKS